MILRNIFIGLMVSIYSVFSTASTIHAQETTRVHTEEDTIEELMESIQRLLETIASLQAQITALNSEERLSATLFSVDMGLGDENPMIKDVQRLLNSDPRTKVATTGPGSPGNETDYFGSRTKDAVIRFQELYSAEILTPNDLVRGSGYIGPSTRAKMNSLAGSTQAGEIRGEVLPIKEKGGRKKSNRSVPRTDSPDTSTSSEPVIDEPVVDLNTLVSDPNNYRLTRISTTGDEDTPDNSSPLDITLDDNGNPWVTGEFQFNIININKETNSANIYPLPEAGSIFGWFNNGIASVSILAEDITKDSFGNIWITQGGAYVEFTGLHNHSRVISINPTTIEMTTYNVVENHSSAMGIMYDEEIDKIYFIEAGLYNNQPKLVSFTPGSIDTSIGFDDQAGLDALNCVDADNRDNCYFVEDIPWRGPARLVKGLDGNIYFTGPYDNYLGRYNPETRGFKKFNLPVPRWTTDPALQSSVPWDIEVDRSTGDILLTEHFDTQIIRFQTTKEANNECQIEKVSVDDSVEQRGNPELENCVIEYEALPEAELRDPPLIMTHSLDIDGLGNVWFTTSDYVGVLPIGESIAKFRRIEGADVNIPEGINLTDHMTGVRVDKNTGDVWINSFASKEVYRLERDF